MHSDYKWSKLLILEMQILSLSNFQNIFSDHDEYNNNIPNAADLYAWFDDSNGLAS